MATPKEFKITANGEHRLEKTAPGLGFVRISVRGNFGGGSLAFGVIVENSAGNEEFVVFASPAAVATTSQVVLEVGGNMIPAVNLSGSSGADIAIIASGAY